MKSRDNSENLDPNAPRRLAKRLSELGLCSRREGEEYILRGWVLVDGIVVREVATRVTPHQKVELSKEASNKQGRRVTILLNKPIGYVSGQPEKGYEPAIKLITDDNRDRRFPGEALKAGS
jgi:23S rRNA pseudouridine2604 synthase